MIGQKPATTPAGHEAITMLTEDEGLGTWFVEATAWVGGVQYSSRIALDQTLTRGAEEGVVPIMEHAVLRAIDEAVG